MLVVSKQACGKEQYTAAEIYISSILGCHDLVHSTSLECIVIDQCNMMTSKYTQRNIKRGMACH